MSEIREELLSLEKRIISLEKDRSRSMLKLGEIKYAELRDIPTDEDSLKTIIQDIKALDKDMFACRSRMGEIIELQAELFCDQCQASITPEDKFCKECGNPVNMVEEKVEVVGACKECNLELMNRDKFCPRCGSKA